MVLYSRQDLGLLLQGARSTVGLRAHQVRSRFSSLMVGLRSSSLPCLQSRVESMTALPSEKPHVLFLLKVSCSNSWISLLSTTQRFPLLSASSATYYKVWYLRNLFYSKRNPQWICYTTRRAWHVCSPLFESQRTGKWALNNKMIALPYKGFELKIGEKISIIGPNPGSFSKSDYGQPS